MRFKNRVIATVRNANGDLISRQRGHNTITDGSPPDPGVLDNGRFFILERMFNNGEEYDPDNYINKIKLGTGTPDDDGLGSLYSATGLPEVIAVIGTIDVSSPAAPVITVKGTWDSSYAALSGITEAGLFADAVSDDVLFAFKTFSPALAKTTGGTLEIEWEITVS